MAVDASGNLTITGSFTGTVSFGGAALTSAGAEDIFVASYGPTGVHRWSKRFGGAAGDAGHSVAVDASGNVFVTGYVEGAVSFGGAPVGNAGQRDGFVASFDPGGGPRWSQGLGGAGSDYGNDLVVDGSGNLTVVGSYQGTADFGDGPVTSLGSDDAFAVSFDPAGAQRWSRVSGSAGSDAAHAVGVDGSGRVTLAGRFQGSADFGGGGLPWAGGNDVFVASYGPLNLHRWSRAIGFPADDVGNGVAVDSGGNVAVTGHFMGSVNFGGGLITSAGGQDIFVASYEPTGAARWSRSFGGAGNEVGHDVAADRSGNLVVTGTFTGTADLGGSPLTSAGGQDIFVGIYGPAGTHRWSKGFGGTGDEVGNQIAVDGAGVISLVGSFSDTVDFGGGPLKSAGDKDVFVLQLEP